MSSLSQIVSLRVGNARDGWFSRWMLKFMQVGAVESTQRHRRHLHKIDPSASDEQFSCTNEVCTQILPYGTRTDQYADRTLQACDIFALPQIQFRYMGYQCYCNLNPDKLCLIFPFAGLPPFTFAWAFGQRPSTPWLLVSTSSRCFPAVPEARLP